jgi:hypothetical protein
LVSDCLQITLYHNHFLRSLTALRADDWRADGLSNGQDRDYQASAFDALKPQPRSDFRLSHNLSAPLVERLAQIKEQQLTRPIRSIIDEPREEGLIEPDQHVAVSSVHRLLQHMGLMTPGVAPATAALPLNKPASCGCRM